MKIKDIASTYKIIIESKGVIRGVFYMVSLFLQKIVKILYINYIKTFSSINKRLLIFKSTPDFADNARALVEYMICNGYDADYDIHFVVEDIKKSNELYGHFPLKFLSCSPSYWNNSFRNLRLMYTANYILCTHGMVLNKSNGRRGQHFIRLWHGCGYKDKTIYDGDGERIFDLALVPGKLFIKTKSSFWNVNPQRILAKGYPRYDWLKTKDRGTAQMVNQIKNESQNKIIIWMPTFRNDKNGKYNETCNITNFPLVYNNNHWNALDDYCRVNNVILVVKLHPFQRDYDIPFTGFSNIKEICDNDFENYGVTLYQFLAYTDGLISDYSSVAIDYLLVNRPIAFTLDDFDLYKNSRGFIFDNPREYMPGHHLYSFDDLKGFIRDVSNGIDTFQDSRKEMMSIAIYQSDCYCKDILDAIGLKCDKLKIGKN